MEENQLRKYLFLIIVAGLAILSFFIVKPFFVPLISAFILAYLIKPVYDLFNRKLNHSVSALLCILLIILVLIIPISLLATALLNQANESLSSISLDKSSINNLRSLPILENLDLEQIRSRGIQLFIQILTNTAKQIPHFVLSILILVLSLFYILINWEYLSKSLKNYIPFKNKNKIAEEISLSTKQIVYGYVLIAILEFVVASLGFYIAGVKFFFLFAALIALFAFIPGLGPGVVWGLLAIYNFVIQDYYTAIVVIITGLIISIVIEAILFPRIVGGKAKIHPLLVLIGVIGGVPLFGIFGFIIGPLILVYTIKLVKEITLYN